MLTQIVIGSDVDFPHRHGRYTLATPSQFILDERYRSLPRQDHRSSSAEALE
jgi:hypothetical protein